MRLAVLFFLSGLHALAVAPPVEFRIDISRAPDLQPWSEQAPAKWSEAYPTICEELSSPGFDPPRAIGIAVDPEYDGIAEFTGSGIVVSAKFIREHPAEADGAIVHEIAHAVQSYGDHPVPMWLVEGIADYVRFFRCKTGELGPINPDRAHSWGSYRVTASFLNYLVTRYDPNAVRKLNQAAREGLYRDSLFVDIIGKTDRALEGEWRATLPRTPADFAPGAAVDVERSDGVSWAGLLAGGAVGAAAGLAFTKWRLHRRSGRRAAGSLRP